MDQGQIVVSFKLNVEEARRQAADLQKAAGVTKTSSRLMLSAAIGWLAIGILEVAIKHTTVSGWSYVFGGCVYVALALQTRSRMIEVPAGVETRLRFGIAGIVVEDPAPQTLPWSAVKGVDRYGGALVVRFLAAEIKAPLEKRLVIPKDVLPDGGIALWNLWEQMLIGPVRRVSSQLSLDETGAVRRTDAMHIENIRAAGVWTKRTPLPVRSVSQS